MTALFDQRTCELDGSCNEIRRLDRVATERDLPARDPRHVEQVVHQAFDVPRLALDHADFARDFLRASKPEQVDGGGDRRERVAQLVAEHRSSAETFTLAPH